MMGKKKLFFLQQRGKMNFILDYKMEAHYHKFSHHTDLPLLQTDQMIPLRISWQGLAAGNTPFLGETGIPYLTRQR